MFKADQYFDQDTQRMRWGVYHTQTRCWYFAKRYGKHEAVVLALNMNRNAK